MARFSKQFRFVLQVGDLASGYVVANILTRFGFTKSRTYDAQRAKAKR